MARHSPKLADVGVVIPVFNRAKTLTRTLPYVTAQTVLPQQLVIVDDGSTDDSADEAERWLVEHQPTFDWKVIRHAHVGAATARNLGMEALRHVSYVAFLDSDDHWPTDFIERTSRLLQQNPMAVAISVDRRFLDKDERVLRQDDCAQLAQNPIEWMYVHGAGIASCSLFRLDIVHQAGNWPDEMVLAEDFRLFVEVAQQGKWLHGPGEPVDFDLGFAASHGEQENLSYLCEDDWHWICVYEQVYQELCDRNVPIDRAKIQEAIAVVWNRVGKSLLTQGQREEAQNCFVQSIRWKPAQWRAWRRLALNAILRNRVFSPRGSRDADEPSVEHRAESVSS